MRCARERVWIVDPLDGTREYGEARTDWAVHVALAIEWRGRDRRGRAARPGRDILHRAAAGPAKPRFRQARACWSAAHARPRRRWRWRRALGAELVPMGSAGAKAMAVLRGEADIYLHTGGQYEWDNCAPAAVALAAGFHVSRVDGSPLLYNQPDPYLPDLLICRKELVGGVMAALEAR